MKVAVLKGGSSFERAVSLRSAARVEDAVEANGWEVLPIDVGPELVSTLISAKPDVAFIALHGPGGEDGTPQELLEILGIPHTGPGVAACIRCMDKVIAKHELRDAGVPTPDWVAFSELAFRTMGAADALGPIEERLGFPLIVKPAGQGSSLGVKLVQDAGEMPAALLAALSYDRRVVLERYVPGRELAVSILDGELLPILEVRPKESDIFNFEARYEIGRTDYVCPAELSSEEADAVNEVSLRTWEVLGLGGFARVDLILGPDGPQVLEVNTSPGLTDTSLLPMAAEAAGISFEAFVRRAVELAQATTPNP